MQKFPWVRFLDRELSRKFETFSYCPFYPVSSSVQTVCATYLTVLFQSGASFNGTFSVLRENPSEGGQTPVIRSSQTWFCSWPRMIRTSLISCMQKIWTQRKNIFPHPIQKDLHNSKHVGLCIIYEKCGGPIKMCPDPDGSLLVLTKKRNVATQMEFIWCKIRVGYHSKESPGKTDWNWVGTTVSPASGPQTPNQKQIARGQWHCSVFQTKR